jgi:hypothetical protein
MKVSSKPNAIKISRSITLGRRSGGTCFRALAKTGILPMGVEICLISIVLLVYLPMRKSVRHIADAPNELLDERQIALRNNAYLFAYRGMLYVALIYVVVYYLISRELFQIPIPLDEIKPTNLILSFFFWMAYMPSMVLAWGMPSEN